VNLGVAAHITAASPGGPRYNESLTATERAAAANGIWLCQTCGKLVDADVPGYSVELLRRWKAETEELRLGAAHGSISEPLDLALPFVDADDFLLSYTNRTLDDIGREQELADLAAFLDDNRPFCRWLWTGPAGVGKSRLALELCHAKSADWHAGSSESETRIRVYVQRAWAREAHDFLVRRAAWRAPG
jgi:hypothetical protein